MSMQELLIINDQSIRNLLTYFSSVLEAPTQASFGEGIGRVIWLSNVQCTGSEGTLLNCTFNFNQSNSCTHAQDAGVSCLLGTE